MKFTVPMAIEDFVPVALAGIGFFVLARVMVPRENRVLGLAGATLITLAGFSKATWKLIMALSDGAQDVIILSGALFVLMAPGFLLLASALRVQGAADQPHPSRRAWMWGGGLAVIALGVATALELSGSEKGGRITLLATMVLANATVLITAARRAWTAGQWGAGWLFIAYLATGFIMGGLGRMPQSVGLQWIEQSVNSVGSGLLCLGAVLYARRQARTPALVPSEAA